MKMTKAIGLLFSLLLVFMAAGNVWGKTVTLSWDASPSDIIGYKIYYDTVSSADLQGSGADQGSSPISRTLDQLNNELTLTITGLEDGDEHYFAVTAYDSNGNESVYSNTEFSPSIDPVDSVSGGGQTTTDGDDKSVTLSWDASPSDVVGYKIYYDTSSSDNLDGSGADQGSSPITRTLAQLNDGLTFVITGLPAASDHYFAVTAYDSSGNESVYSNTEYSPAVDSVNPNSAPELTSPGNKSILEKAQLSFTLSASDADNDALTFAVSSLPSGASFNDASGFFSWTPTSAQSGSYSLTFSVSDGNGGSDSQTIAVSVVNIQENRAPVLASIGSKGVNEGDTQYIPISASDADGDALTYTVSGLPAGATFDTGDQLFKWPTTYSQSGSYPITFRVSDGALNDSETITITVNDVNRAPTLSAIGDKVVPEGQTLSFSVVGSDADSDTLTYSSAGLPEGASFDAQTGQFSWTPGYDSTESYDLTFRVSDGSSSASEQMTINVGNTNREPVMAAIGNKSVAEKSTLQFTVGASDADGDSLTYSSSALPAGASFNTQTGQFSWTPGFDQAKSYGLTFTVSDGSSSISEEIAIIVSNTNQKPVISAIGNKSVDEMVALVFAVNASDADGDALTYSVSTLPEGATFSSSAKTFSWTPDYGQAENYSIRFSVSDGTESVSEEVNISVGNVNRPPVLTAIGAQSFTEGEDINLIVSASDPDGGSLLYGASGLPDGAVFTPATRSFSWTPDPGQAGTYQVTFAVTDDIDSDSEKVTFTIVKGNEAPVFSTIGAQSAEEGQPLVFSVSATDPNGDAITYSATGLPSGATFNAETQQFTWTPGYDQAAVYTITFRAIDPANLVDSEVVTITVADVNRVPVISGSPLTVGMAQSAYRFTPTASDPDGDDLSFSITNKPAWADFDTTTGTLSGTPGSAETGTFAAITIQVSDGTNSASLPQFSIAVADYEPVDSDGDGVPDHLDPFPNDASEYADTDGDGIGNNSDNDDDNDGIVDSRDGYPLDAAKSGWVITAISGSGGYITPEGESSVAYGDDQGYSLAATDGYYVADLLVDGVSVGLRGSYEFTNIAAHHTIEAIFAEIPAGLSHDPLAVGLPGVERSDGGDDSNNLVDGEAQLLLDYRFDVVLRDDNGSQLKVYLVLNGYKHLMSLASGNYATGAEFNLTMPLGPSSAHDFYYIAEDDSDNQLWRYPYSGSLAGPEVSLIDGRNLVGVAADVDGLSLGVSGAFDGSRVRSWNSSIQRYAVAKTVSSGTGYVFYSDGGVTLPDLSSYGQVTSESYGIALKRGWNLIANPYGGRVFLRDVMIQHGSELPLSWGDAVSENLVVEVIFTYAGDRANSTNLAYTADGENAAVLTPQIGYWIYVNTSDGDLSLQIPKPQQ